MPPDNVQKAQAATLLDAIKQPHDGVPGKLPTSLQLLRQWIQESLWHASTVIKSAAQQAIAKTPLHAIAGRYTLTSYLMPEPGPGSTNAVATGVWGNGAGPTMPAGDRDFLEGLKLQIQDEVFGPPAERSAVPTGIVNNSTLYDAQQYLAGKDANASEPAPQRLQDVLSVLGPGNSYALLAGMPSSEITRLQGAFNGVVGSGNFTPSDAAKLAGAQAQAAKSDDLYATGNVNDNNASDLIDGLPSDGSNVKIGYAEACLSQAQDLNVLIAGAKLSGFERGPLVTARNSLYQQASDAAAGASGDDCAKIKIFAQYLSDAKGLKGPEAAATSTVLQAYAANVLGTLSDKAQIAKTLAALGGVTKDGYIEPGSGLDSFLHAALSGQAQIGFGVFNSTDPLAEIPRGVTSLLGGLSGSGDPELEAGVLDNVAQWSIAQPSAAQVLAAQDGIGGTGYRAALTNLMNHSFNQLVALDPSDPNATVLRSLQPQPIADLQVLSGIVLGAPFDVTGAGNYAGMFYTHAVQFAAFAAGQQTPGTADLTKLLASAGDPRHAASEIYAASTQSFIAGYNQNDVALQKEAGKAGAVSQAAYHERIATDIARGVGTGLLLASIWVTGGTDAPFAIGLGATASNGALVGALGRVGLFSGSAGTLILDAFANPANAAAQYQKFEGQQRSADSAPLSLMNAMYDGWFSKISQLDPGGLEGQSITDGASIGASAATTAGEQYNVAPFFNNYDPLGYYKDETGSYPPIAPAAFAPPKPPSADRRPPLSTRPAPAHAHRPAPRTPPTTAAPSPPTGRTDPTLAREGYKAVTVQHGETIWAIAVENGANPFATIALNASHICDPNEIYPGDVIYLPKRG
jgi:hypothetical protein